MHTFFYGWRRKVGVATLVMACLFFVAWARGTSTFDRIGFAGSDSFLVFHFSNPTFSYPGIYAYYGQVTDREYPPRTEWISLANQYSLEEFREMREQHAVAQASDEAATQGYWKMELWLFAVGGVNTGWEITIPYWSVIIPLTLLSAYLILWTPRKTA
jgi:hypothetical protein